MKVLFIDRDGTIIKEPSDEQVDSFDKLDFYPKALTYLPKIANELDYKLVMVTNQDGLGTDLYPNRSLGNLCSHQYYQAFPRLQQFADHARSYGLPMLHD